MIPFLFLLAFEVLSGVVGAALFGRFPVLGWVRIAVGIFISAVIFLVALVVQFAILRLLRDTRGIAELTQTGLILMGACAILWFPAIGLAYTALPKSNAKG